MGDVLHYQARFDRFSTQIKERWQEENIPGVGNHYDLGSHLIDQALFLFGKPDWVQGDVYKQRSDSAIFDTFHLRMGQGKRRIDIGAGMLVADNTLRYQVHGTKGSWQKHHLDPQESQLWHEGVKATDDRFGHEPEERFGQLTVMSKDGKTVSQTPTVRGNWPGFYQELALAIRQGTPPPVTAEQARDTINIIELMVESSRLGKRLDVN